MSTEIALTRGSTPLRTRVRLLVTALLAVALATGGAVVAPTAAIAAGGGTVLSDETFSGDVVLDSRWQAFGDACLTAAAAGAAAPAGASNLAGCTKSVDSSIEPGIGTETDGYLQLTDNSGGSTSNVLYDRAFPATAGLDIEFYQYQYALTNRGLGAADGIGFFLTDGSYDLNQPGPTGAGSGGALGYATINDQDGVQHGYVGVGLDVYGNNSNQPYVGTSCPDDSGFAPNRVTVRGPGNGADGYCLISSSDPTVQLSANSLVASERLVRILVSPVTATDLKPTITVYIDGTEVSSTKMTVDAPKTVKLGFAASTGGGHEVHLVREVVVKTVDPLGDISLVKTVDHSATTGTDKTVFTAGDTVPYSFLVTNTGTEALHDVSVTDPKIGEIVCPATTLDVLGSFVCTGTYGPLTSEEAATGTFINEATVNGTTSSGVPVSDDSDATVPTYMTGSFSVIKSVTGTGSSIADAATPFTVNYSYPSGAYVPASTNAAGEPNTYPAGSGSLTLRNDGQAVATSGIPVGAVVTLDEQTPVAIPGGTWGTPVYSPGSSVTVPAAGGDPVSVVLTNPLSLDTGVFTVTKRVTGATELLSGDEVFSGGFTWSGGPAGHESGEGSFTVADGGSWTSSPLPVGAVVTGFRETTPAAVAGGTWGAGSFSAASVTVPAAGGDPVSVVLTNPLSLDTGVFTVTKQVTGDGAARVPADASFTVEYSLDEGATWTALPGLTPQNLTVTGPDVAVGTRVELREVAPAPGASYVWDEPRFSIDGSEPAATAAFTVSDKGENVAIDLVNTAHAVDGTFTVTKKITGAGASLVTDDASFTVKYAYGDQTGEIVLRAGQVAPSDPIPAGTRVTITEVTPTGGLVAGASWGTPRFVLSDGSVLVNGSTIVVDADRPMELVLENPTVPPLPATGGQLPGVAGGIAVLFLGLGTGLLMIARRRRSAHSA